MEPAYECDDRRIVRIGTDHPDVLSPWAWADAVRIWSSHESLDAGGTLVHGAVYTPGFVPVDLPIADRVLTFELTPSDDQSTLGITVGYSP